MLKTCHLFTPIEANNTLPLVRRIVADILRTGRRVRALSQEQGDSFDTSPEVRHLMSELQDLLSELENIGCSYKDCSFTVGIVDFPAMIDGEEVSLCWRSDEPEIMYYHGINAGYSNRRPIPGKCLFK
jgi:hypothetical protein